MPRFRFHLQAVLDHRWAVEREHQRAVALLERQRQGLESGLRDCQQDIVSGHVVLRQLLARGDMPGVRRQAAAVGTLETRASRTAIELAALHQRLSQARQQLLAAARRRMALERLRTRCFEQWKQEIQRRDAAATDDLIVSRHRYRESPL